MNLIYNFRDLIQTKQRQMIGVNPNSLAMLASFTFKLLFIVAAENSYCLSAFFMSKNEQE